MFEINSEKILDGRIGLLAFTEEVDESTYLYVTEVNDFAYDTLHRLVPHGDTGNLRTAVRRYGQAVPGPLVGEPFSWVARTYIDDKAVGPYYRHRPRGPGAQFQPHTDRPIEYVLSLNDGRRALIRNSPYAGKFAWYDSRRPMPQRKNGKAYNSKYGYNVFTKRLRPRAGLHFIETTQQLTEAFAAEKVQAFMRGKGRTTAASRRSFRTRLGLPVKGIDF